MSCTSAKGSILIEGLRVFSYIGVLPQEKTVGNTFETDVRLDFDCGRVLENGDIADTINYAAAVETIRHEIEKPAELLEETGGRIRRALCAQFPAISGGSIALYKIHPPIAAELARVGFRLEW